MCGDIWRGYGCCCWGYAWVDEEGESGWDGGMRWDALVWHGNDQYE